MGVADGQIIEAALDPGIATNGKVRLMTVDVKGGTMDAADAKPFVTRFTWRQRHCEIVLTCF
jgi:hypothetical protein